jgi:hypothetical protein
MNCSFIFGFNLSVSGAESSPLTSPKRFNIAVWTEDTKFNQQKTFLQLHTCSYNFTIWSTASLDRSGQANGRFPRAQAPNCRPGNAAPPPRAR